MGRASVTDSLIDKSFVVPDYALIWKKINPPTPANAGAVG